MSASRPLRVCLVAGARPNFVKIAPILRAVEAAQPALVARLVHTGQHYDQRLSEVFFRDLGIRQPDVNLGVGSGTQAGQTAAVMTAFEDYCAHDRPDLVMVVGDVNSTLACSLVAAKACITLAHVEAGLRSFDRTMPEEVNRIVTDRLSDLLFISEESGLVNLHREGVPDAKVHFVGNVMIDTLLHSIAQLDAAPPAQLPKVPFALLTMHRPSNVDMREALEPLLDLLGEFARELPIVFPVHPRTAARMEEFGLRGRLTRRDAMGELAAGDGLVAVPPVGYMEFLDLMRHAKLVLTDSGGIQEETTALGIPCITLRENTERPATVTIGTNYLVGTDPDRIREAFAECMAGGRPEARVPPLWDGRAAERIVEVLLAGAEG